MKTVLVPTGVMRELVNGRTDDRSPLRSTGDSHTALFSSFVVCYLLYFVFVNICLFVLYMFYFICTDQELSVCICCGFFRRVALNNCLFPVILFLGRDASVS